MKKIIFVLGIITLVFSVVLGIQTGGNLTYAIATEPVGFDPNLTTALASFKILSYVYDGLLRYNRNMEIVPDLAENYTVPNPYTIIFTLKKDVKFHDGSLLTVNDVLFTFKRIMDPSFGSPAISYFSGVVDKIEALNDDQIEFKLKVPMASALLPVFTFVNCSIVSEKFVKSGANLQLETDGTGPFYIKQYVPGNYILLEKNPNYFITGEPYLDSIKFTIMPEEILRVSALRSNRIDIADIDNPSDLVILPKNQFEIYETPSLNYYLVGLNTARKPFDNKLVREALSYAINREEIIKMVAAGEGIITGPLSPSLKNWALPLDDFPEYNYNPIKAKELLKEAGYPNGFSFELLTSPKYGFDKIAQVIKDQLAKVGINANINLVEWGIFIKDWREKNFDAFISLNGGSTDPDIQLYRTFYSNGITNVFNFSNAQVDQLLNAGRSATNTIERQNIYDNLQKILVSESPVIFLYSPINIVASLKNVEGFEILPNGDMTLTTTWIKQ